MGPRFSADDQANPEIQPLRYLDAIAEKDHAVVARVATTAELDQ
jgi:hypothetical protein